MPASKTRRHKGPVFFLRRLLFFCTLPGFFSLFSFFRRLFQFLPSLFAFLRKAGPFVGHMPLVFATGPGVPPLPVFAVPLLRYKRLSDARVRKSRPAAVTPRAPGAAPSCASRRPR